ncbi:Fur family transcriptional regulator [Mycolicibacterium komossense]|uniref:Transcriptional repressor n=1 Tax=Mycolicibacterium komossense TaxID=1779 RepID=A0ABT3CB10_9MYCO|nr:Fur family transcriptional regulator [Mycolicibacterium komossense]MCV7226648.1 transcriptional repressor [Mycolicibacterium komossense]
MTKGSAATDHSVEQARSILRRHGLRCTAPRLAVTSVLFAVPEAGHLNAQEIVALLEERGDPVDLTTVYRTLATLVDVGALHALTVHERTTYGLTANAHHHAVCTSCGEVIEVPAEQLSQALAHASDGSRFALSATAGLTLHGLCPRCQLQASG